jgi:hypothetical protein
MDAHVEARATPRRDGVERVVDGRDVDPGDRDRRAGPHPRAEAAAPDERHPGEDLREVAELVLAVGGSGPLLSPEPLDRDVAVLIVQ